LVALGTGCFGPSEEAKASLAAVMADGQQMDEQLSNLEDRFLGTQARVLLWRELAERHKSVSAISCNNATTHALAMRQHEQKEDRKTRQKRLAKNTVASRALQTGQF